MEKRVINKVDEYIHDFKKNIKSYLEECNVDHSTKGELIQFVYDYEKLSLEKTDFAKRKRVKSVVPLFQRCTAKRANGDQCTRKKKDDSCYCGTHEKNRPHGEVDKHDNTQDVKLKKMEVWLQEINGILYYIDKFSNVYKTDDIVNNKIHPDIYAKYNIDTNNNYSLVM